MTGISAIVPTYNRAATLRRALASIIGQTRPPEEVIVVDDASTDATADVLRDYPAVRVVRLDRTGGAANARNEGVRHARGDCIAFLDSDDVWVSHKLELQAAALERSGADLVCTGIIVHERGGGVAYHGRDGVSPPAGWTFREFQNYPFSPSTWLIRRAVFEVTGPFDAGLQNCEDLDYLARMSGRHRMQVLPDAAVIKYNLHDSLDADLARTAASYEVLFARHAALWERAPAALVASHVRLAGMYLEAGHVARARAALWRCARQQPLHFAPWTLLAALPLGPRVYWRVYWRLWRRVA